MTTFATALPELIEKLPPASTLTLRGLSWDEYEALLDAVGETSALRISYDEGTLQVMTLSSEHEHYAGLIKDFVRLASLVLRIKVLSFGSTTIKKVHALKGTEPDACFYVQSAGKIGNKIHIDFATDPPPDIVVEVDISHESMTKLPIYAGLGVPEVWHFDGRVLTIYRLEQDHYVISPDSVALPVLTSERLTEFLNRAEKEGQYETVVAFEEWLRNQRPKLV